jgi:hypothetical protein
VIMVPKDENTPDSILNNSENHKEELVPLRKAQNGAETRRESPPPPWLFKHHDLNTALESARIVDESVLRNKLNHIHFMNKDILVLLRHPRYDDLLIVTAKPSPCTGGVVTCQLLADHASLPYLERYTFLHLIINDGQSVILIPAALIKVSGDYFSFQLPQKAYSVGQRQVRRYSCEKIEVELVQRGLIIKGELLDYSSKGFCVRIGHMPRGGFDWAPGSDVFTVVNLRRDNKSFFSGLCQCLRKQEGTLFTDVVLAPSKNQGNLYERERARKISKNIPLSPVIIFDHPFIGKRIHLEASSISTSGFSVYEKGDEGVLIEGMIIPDLIIEFAGSVQLTCSAQVIGCSEEEPGTICSYLSILDMGINAYSQLCHILANALDSHAYISKEVDMEALWELFFEAGFIYPKKYAVLQQDKERFKKTWSRLYQQDLEISKHVTYQKNGRIFGHISMLRAYERTWMIHHHAARRVKGGLAGLIVLKQMMDYLSDMHALPSANMDYVMSYFRPENKFPNSVFGGFARAFGNPQACSMDLFTYLPYKRLNREDPLPEGWSLSRCSSFDLWELGRFYDNYSKGLFIDAMGFSDGESQGSSIEEVFQRLGFFRRLTAYSLKHAQDLNAVLVLDQSDVGFNLSDLLNAIKVVVINLDGLAWDVLSSAVSQLVHEFDTEKVPVLCFPFEYIDATDIPYEKQYCAWILNVQYGKDFVDYVHKRFRLTNR